MRYIAKIRDQRRAPSLPASYDGLLLAPVADDPSAVSKSYTDWEFDHGAHCRFYVGGLRWFMRESGIASVKELMKFAPAAADFVRDETDWREMPSSHRQQWDVCSINQFSAAANKKPVFFQKAALVIATCQMAMKQKIQTDKSVASRIERAEHVYTHMSVIPATWSINDFNAEALRELRRQYENIDNALVNAAGQDAKTFLDHMAKGHTVTYETARTVKWQLENHFTKVSVGKLRAKPQSGSLKACEFEIVDTDGDEN